MSRPFVSPPDFPDDAVSHLTTYINHLACNEDTNSFIFTQVYMASRGTPLLYKDKKNKVRGLGVGCTLEKIYAAYLKQHVSGDAYKLFDTLQVCLRKGGSEGVIHRLRARVNRDMSADDARTHKLVILAGSTRKLPLTVSPGASFSLTFGNTCPICSHTCGCLRMTRSYAPKGKRSNNAPGPASFKVRFSLPFFFHLLFCVCSGEGGKV